MSNDKTEQPIPETEWVPANKKHDIIIQAGDRIRIYGNQTIVEGFYGIYNEGLERWETIILTTKRGDPFERTINDIEVDAGKKHINPHSLPPSPVEEAGPKWVKASERVPEGNQRVIMRFGGRSSTAWAGIVEIQLGKVIAPFNALPPETVEWLDENNNNK